MHDTKDKTDNNLIAMLKIYMQPAFLICVIVLAVAGSGMSMAIKSFGVYLKKEPLPLKKSLELLDKNNLAPYEIVTKHKIENKEIVKSLGTEDYIQWILEDTTKSLDSPVRKALLFITYYKLPDRVPHVPEECYTGGGFQRLSSDPVVFKVNNGDFKAEVGGRCLVFGSVKVSHWRKDASFPVLYFFKVNGEYAGNREEARITLNKNLFKKTSYFSKIELVFNQKTRPPTKEEATEASEKILNVILPILERDHWPQW